MRVILSIAALQLLLTCLVSATQMPFLTGSSSMTSPFSDLRRIELPLEIDTMQSSTSGRTVEEMIAAENGKHVILTHQDFPELSIRIKRVAGKTRTVNEMMLAKSGSDPKYNHSDPTAFCDPTTTSWSGCE